MTLSGTQKTKCASKVFHIKPSDGEDFYVGFAGDASEIIDVVDFFEHPEVYKRAPKLRNTIGLVLTETGKIFTFQSPTNWVEVKEKYFSIGSGAMPALGAMHVGATPKQAVEAACKLDPFSGMGVKTFNF